jgi:hypothetical protein
MSIINSSNGIDSQRSVESAPETDVDSFRYTIDYIWQIEYEDRPLTPPALFLISKEGIFLLDL